ncbi:MAG: hypothetical protein ABSH25_15655, partial [Syntrophorhabdales bacterium]
RSEPGSNSQIELTLTVVLEDRGLTIFYCQRTRTALPCGTSKRDAKDYYKLIFSNVKASDGQKAGLFPMDEPIPERVE